MVGRVDIQPDKIDRRRNDAQIFGRIFRRIVAGLGKICIGIFPLQHQGQITGIEFTRRDLGGADVCRCFNGGNTAHGILSRTDPGAGPCVRPDRLHRKTVSQRDVVTNLILSRPG